MVDRCRDSRDHCSDRDPLCASDRMRRGCLITLARHPSTSGIIDREAPLQDTLLRMWLDRPGTKLDLYRRIPRARRADRDPGDRGRVRNALGRRGHVLWSRCFDPRRLGRVYS